MEYHSIVSTGVTDDRDEGAVLRLGTGRPQLLYVNVNNKVFLGPVYTVHDFMKPYGTRLTDEEWDKEMSNYHPLTPNNI